MIKAIAIDDERNALGIITEFCDRIPDMQLAGVFSDPLKALTFLSGNPDINLIFLDIQMSKLNGLLLAQKVNTEKLKIIITTAYPDYALQGYEIDVVDYLLKPFSFARFERAIQKTRDIMSVNKDPQDSMNKRLIPAYDDFIFVKTDYKIVKIRLSEVLFIEGSGNYITIHTSKGKILTLQNLKHFEEQLKPYQFVRIHKSYIVSVNQIDSIENKYIRIANHELPIGESYKDEFREFMNRNFKQF
ncbi:MAG: LytR/AlgR family response regulator transcription factor [Chitinophagaceae bacterium]